MENEIELKALRIEKLLTELEWILDKVKNEMQREGLIDIETLKLYKRFFEVHTALMEEIEPYLKRVFKEMRKEAIPDP